MGLKLQGFLTNGGTQPSCPSTTSFPPSLAACLTRPVGLTMRDTSGLFLSRRGTKWRNYCTTFPKHANFRRHEYTRRPDPNHISTTHAPCATQCPSLTEMPAGVLRASRTDLRRPQAPPATLPGAVPKGYNTKISVPVRAAIPPEALAPMHQCRALRGTA